MLRSVDEIYWASVGHWTPVFPLVSGIVLEIGGQPSHGAVVDHPQNILLKPGLTCYNIRKQAISFLSIDLISKIVFCYIIQVDKLHIDELHSKPYYKYTYTGEDTAQNSYGRTYADR
jgi:hypothetical protein